MRYLLSGIDREPFKPEEVDSEVMAPRNISEFAALERQEIFQKIGKKLKELQKEHLQNSPP